MKYHPQTHILLRPILGVLQNAVQNQGTQNVENQNGLSVVSEIANQYGNGNVVTTPTEGNGNGINGNQIRCYSCSGEGHYASNCTVKPRKRDAAYLQTQLQIAQKDEAGIQLKYEEFDFMAAAGAYDEIKKVTSNCTDKFTLENLFPMDDEPMWAVDRVVAPTPGFEITIPETANEFSIKDTENEAVRLMMFPLSLPGEAKTWLDELNEGTIETWDELRTAFISRFFPHHFSTDSSKKSELSLNMKTNL
ncbi:putative reverse transcriptase domain-containing protein [Tanacetum coccineum]